MKVRKRLTAGKGIPQSGPIPRRQTVRVKRPDDAFRGDPRPDDHSILWADVRPIIYLRSGGRCERCGTGLNIHNMEAHHRRTRSIGPDCPCNALALCSLCHHGPEVHAGPFRARKLGTIISRHYEGRPENVPVDVHGRGTVLLACDGTYRLADVSRETGRTPDAMRRGSDP